MANPNISERNRIALHDAVLRSDVELIKSVLLEGTDLDALDSGGKTPLHHAVLNSHMGIIELLLEHGVDVNIVDNLNSTPLLCAVLKSHLGIVQLLLEHGANANASGYSRQKPLHCSVRQSHFGIAALLLKHGANVNDVDISGNTPLNYAAMLCPLDIIELLLEHGANVNARDNSGSTPLLCVMNRWLNHLIKPEFGIIELLLKHGANVNPLCFPGNTPLLSAVHCSHLGIVELLLKYGADVNAFGFSCETPLLCAVRKNHSGIVKLLLKHGANVSALGFSNATPLHYSLTVDKPDISLIQTLIKYGADVNAENINGVNVLDVAVNNPATTYEILKLILENGAIPNFDEKRNVLVRINSSKRYDFAELLIKYIILRISAKYGNDQVLDQFQTILLTHIAKDSDNYKHFLSVARSCVIEVLNMRNEFVHEKRTLFQFLSENCSRTVPSDQNVSRYDINALLLLSKNGKYVQYGDLIYSSIKHSAVGDRLCELEVFYKVSDSNTLNLNYVCTKNITKYLSKEDVLNMITMFDDCESASTCTSKRNSEEIKKNVCKKLRK